MISLEKLSTSKASNTPPGDPQQQKPLIENYEILLIIKKNE